MADSEVQYVTDETGQPVSVIVPIELWREIESERETAYLLRSAKMKERLLWAKSRGILGHSAATSEGTDSCGQE